MEEPVHEARRELVDDGPVRIAEGREAFERLLDLRAADLFDGHAQGGDVLRPGRLEGRDHAPRLVPDLRLRAGEGGGRERLRTPRRERVDVDERDAGERPAGRVDVPREPQVDQPERPPVPVGEGPPEAVRRDEGLARARGREHDVRGLQDPVERVEAESLTPEVPGHLQGAVPVPVRDKDPGRPAEGRRGEERLSRRARAATSSGPVRRPSGARSRLQTRAPV